MILKQKAFNVHHIFRKKVQYQKNQPGQPLSENRLKKFHSAEFVQHNTLFWVIAYLCKKEEKAAQLLLACK